MGQGGGGEEPFRGPVAGGEEAAGEGLGVGVDLLLQLSGQPFPALEGLHEQVLHGWPARLSRRSLRGRLGFGHGGGEERLVAVAWRRWRRSRKF